MAKNILEKKRRNLIQAGREVTEVDVTGKNEAQRRQARAAALESSVGLGEGRSLRPGIVRQTDVVQRGQTSRRGEVLSQQERLGTIFRDQETGETFTSENVPSVPNFIPLPESKEQVGALLQSGDITQDVVQPLESAVESQQNQQILQEQTLREQQPQTQNKEGGIVEDIAAAGAGVPIALINTISAGLSLAGLETEQINTREFVATDVGRNIGLATAGLAAAGAIAGGIYAATLIPAAATNLTPALAAKGAVGAAAANTSLATKLASTSLLEKLGIFFAGKAAIGSLVGAVSSPVNTRIQELETAIVNQRETMGLVRQAAAQEIIEPVEAVLMMDEFEQDMNEAERSIHQVAFLSPRTWLGKGLEVETRIQKARQQLQLERGLVANSQAAQIPQ